MNIKFLLLGTSLSFIPLTVNAQCVATQDCTTLGYTETSCNGGKGVKCPFGNKWACLGANEEEVRDKLCQELGFTLTCSGENQTGSNYSCNEKFNYCNCADGYGWKNGKCEKVNTQPDYATCKVGALFYSDGSCSNNKLTNKELLGVVVYEKNANQNGWVMTINPIAKEIAWGIYGTTTGITDKAASASCNNTEKLVALGSDYAAAYAANNYKAGNKKWCLPAHDILDNIDNTTNFTKINNGIRVAGGTILGDVSSGYEGIWSSTEYSRYIAWAFQANTSNYFTMVHEFSKASAAGTMLSVRPVFAF